MLLKIVLCCLAFTGGRAAKPDEMVSYCKSAPSELRSGQSGTVRCIFPVDIKDKQFTVDLYKNESSDNSDTIVDCYFIGTQRVCEVKDGFNFTCKSGNEQIVSVMNATKQCEGVYRCHILDQDYRSEHCSVKYEERREANSLISKLTVPENAATNEKKNMAPEKPETDQTSPLSSGVIVGSIVGAVCLLGLLVAGGFIIRRTRHERNTSQKKLIYNPISTNPAVTV